MTTIFHEGRKILRQEIGNHNYAEIADLLYFRIQGTSYYDEDDKPFFLIPNVSYISEETGFTKRSCERALSELDKNNWIQKVKMKCYDGAVRIKVYITDKFKKLMQYIESLIHNKHIEEFSAKASEEDNLKEATTIQSNVISSSHLKDECEIEAPSTPNHSQKNEVTSDNLESASVAESDSANLAKSYIKEKTIKEKYNNTRCSTFLKQS